MKKKRLADRLLAWYHANRRILPWRGVAGRSAYAVWVSEVMLQQTRVETVIPYFEKWRRRFPTVRDLAKASEQDVLNAWEGLGYYSRARNLHKAARIVVEKYNGEIPRDLDELRKLPGIGRYTLGAIASIAFGMDAPALDGNIKRVYARLFDLDKAVDSPAGEELLWRLADENLPKGHAGDYNQALMDLGATICIPKNPRCRICPLLKLCKARQNDTQDRRPVKNPRKPVPHYVHAAGLVIQGGRVLLAQRPSKGLLGGLWEFPNGRVRGDPAKELAKVLDGGYNLQVRTRAGRRSSQPEALGVLRHRYTHFSVTVHVFRCEFISISGETNLNWFPLNDLDAYPMGRIDRQIASMLKKP